MIDTKFSFDKFYKAPLVAIIRGMEAELIHDIAKVYEEAGLTTLEVTLNTKNALPIISSLRETFPNLNIGAGTVCSLQDFESAINAGAQFIVTPIINEEVIIRSKELGIPIFPGAYTPSEIYKAWSLGASAVKVFPATQLGPTYIKDVLGPLNNIKLLPTGGVNLENIKNFLEAGAVGAGLGGTLLNKELIVAKDWNGLNAYFKKYLTELSDYIK